MQTDFAIILNNVTTFGRRTACALSRYTSVAGLSAALRAICTRCDVSLGSSFLEIPHLPNASPSAMAAVTATLSERRLAASVS